MHISFYALDKLALHKMGLVLEIVAQNLVDTIRPPSPTVNTSLLSPNSGLTKAFEYVVHPSTPSRAVVSLEKGNFRISMPQQLTIDGTIHHETCFISGLPAHITPAQIKDALKPHSLVMHEGPSGTEIMDLDTAKMRYTDAFAMRMACELTGESFEKVIEEFPHLKAQDASGRTPIEFGTKRIGDQSGR